MTENPMEILNRFPAPRRRQKSEFASAVQSYAAGLGYRTKTEKGSWGCENIIIGDPETAVRLIAANYHGISAPLALLETASSMPANLRSRVCFVLTDGKAGEALHCKLHPHALGLQTVVTLGRVGKGDAILFRPDKRVCADEEQLRCLIDLERRCGEKRVQILDRKPCRTAYPAGLRVFAKGAGLLEGTPDYTNVNILRACLITWISGVRA